MIKTTSMDAKNVLKIATLLKSNSMKTILQILFSAFLILSCVKANEVDGHHEFGRRCTGSANCTACSNCSSCAHCSSGGSYGVCSGGSSRRSFYSHKSSKKKKRTTGYVKTIPNKSANAYGIYSSSKAESHVRYSGNAHVVSSGAVYAKNGIVNLRKKPSVNAAIIERVPKGTKMVFLGKTGSWYHVKVAKSGKSGYVYSSVVE